MPLNPFVDPIRNYFAGIGSRQTCREIFRIQVRLGMAFALMGWGLRSGAAHGSDEAYELGMDLAAEYIGGVNLAAQKHIYIPWEGFRGRSTHDVGVIMPSLQKSIDFTARYHPRWDKLSKSAQRLMARNANQVLGDSLQRPVQRVLCYTSDGATTGSEALRGKSGGTGQAIRIASDHDVPVFNLGNPAHRQEAEAFLERYDTRMAHHGLRTTRQITDDYLDNYMLLPWVGGDLVVSADRGEFDVLIHGCNCFHTMKSGIAGALAARWPEVAEVDRLMTDKGDRHKLNDYTQVHVKNAQGGDIKIINGYTQYNYGRDPETCYVNYEAVRVLFQKLVKQQREELTGKRIGIPMIGAGLANGEWYVVERLILESLEGARGANDAPLDIKVVRYQQAQAVPASPPQMELTG